MAGTIFGLGLSQRVDSNGKPAVGWLLYLYAQNSSTPVSAYQDTALSVVHPWPIEADANGMMPQFWLADGSYRARGISNDASTVYFDLPSVQAIGPSTGSAPSGSVDPNAIFQTGDTKWRATTEILAGWVRLNARTIGNATSGGTERANADCQALYEHLWNQFADSVCPVGGGRGADALSDFNASKPIGLVDMRGRGPLGLDDMGNAAASRLTGATFATGNATTVASFLGEAAHTTTAAEMPVHTHTATVTDPGHPHNLTYNGSSGASVQVAHQVSDTIPVGGGGDPHPSNATLSVDSATTGITVANADAGSGGAHNNVQPSILVTWYIKL